MTLANLRSPVPWPFPCCGGRLGGGVDVEVAIVGGGPAGIATALSLARNAPALTDRIVVLERARFPRDKICAGGLGARADTLLARLGVELDVPSVPVRGISLGVAAGQIVERSRSSIGRVVRRIEFDDALVCAARIKGIRTIEDARVTAVRRDCGGWVLETLQGELRARVVVGADGVGSTVRRAIGGEPARLHAQVVEADTEPIASDLDRDLLHFEAADHSFPGYCWDFPTIVRGRAMVCRGAYVLRTGPRSTDPAAVLDAHLARRGIDATSVHHKRYAERGYARTSVLGQPGLLLVGEAAGVDPITGEGIPQALGIGELAGRYLAESWEARDWRFEDWTQQVHAARMGLDLALREAIAPRFYGPDREWLERLMFERPWFLRCGVEFFAGRKVPKRDLARLAGFGLRVWLGSMVSGAGKAYGAGAAEAGFVVR